MSNLLDDLKCHLWARLNCPTSVFKSLMLLRLNGIEFWQQSFNIYWKAFTEEWGIFQFCQGYNSLLIPLILEEKLGKETIQIHFVSMREHWAHVAHTCFRKCGNLLKWSGQLKWFLMAWGTFSAYLEWSPSCLKEEGWLVLLSTCPISLHFISTQAMFLKQLLTEEVLLE